MYVQFTSKEFIVQFVSNGKLPISIIYTKHFFMRSIDFKVFYDDFKNICNLKEIANVFRIKRGLTPKKKAAL